MLSPVVNTVPEMLSRTCAVASSFPYDSQRATSPAPTSTTVVPDAVTVTVAVWAIAVPLAVAETVFVPATVELNVPVATPFASFAVTVIVALPLPAVIELGDAATVDCAAETGPGFTVTAAVWVMAVPFAVAETVFVPAPVALSVPVATPLALVGPLGWVRVLPLPVAASTTVAPLIGFPLASWTVTVIVEFPLPAASDVGQALTLATEAESVEPPLTA